MTEEKKPFTAGDLSLAILMMALEDEKYHPVDIYLDKREVERALANRAKKGKRKRDKKNAD